jgi:hypothetical protein
MNPSRSLMFIALVGLALSACATPAEETSSSAGAEPDRTIPAKPPYAETPAPDTNPEEVMDCNAKTMDWAKGKLADEAMVQRIRTETHSKGVRVIKPGMAVTMDYRTDRVNIDVDANNHIVSVRCG